MTEKNMTYAGVGVDYDVMDPHKRKAQQAGMETDFCLERFGFSVVPWSRGESYFLIKMPWGHFAFVVEGLGTKNLVADAMYALAKRMEQLTGKSHYDRVAQCNVAAAVNDVITSGASPIYYGQYLAVGSSDWFDDDRRSDDVIAGTKRACLLAGCAWGGGETPTLKGITIPGTSDLAGATVGFIPDEERLINPASIQHGDAIVFLESSGIHANGLTMARAIAAKLSPDSNQPDLGYLTPLSDLPNSLTYGEALLEPTHIYASAIETLLDHGVDIHYAVNITGHGWRKLMRATQPFAYIIQHMPTRLPIFDFIQEHGPVDDQEAYGNLNMGAGFALYLPDADAAKALDLLRAEGYPFGAHYAGYIEQSNEKKVVIAPRGLEYSGATLAVR